jgi:hypothetical protein
MQANRVESSLADAFHNCCTAAYITVSNNVAIDPGDDCYPVVSYTGNATPAHDITITGNRCDISSARGLVVSGGYNVAFAGNTVSGALACMFFGTETGYLTTYAVTATGNTCINSGSRSGVVLSNVMVPGLSAAIPTRDINIVGNVITSAERSCLFVGSNAGLNSVINVNFSSNTCRGLGDANSAQAILAFGVTNLIINNNFFSDWSQGGFTTTPGTNNSGMLSLNENTWTNMNFANSGGARIADIESDSWSMITIKGNYEIDGAHPLAQLIFITGCGVCMIDGNMGQTTTQTITGITAGYWNNPSGTNATYSPVLSRRGHHIHCERLCDNLCPDRRSDLWEASPPAARPARRSSPLAERLRRLAGSVRCTNLTRLLDGSQRPPPNGIDNHNRHPGRHNRGVRRYPVQVRSVLMTTVYLVGNGAGSFPRQPSTVSASIECWGAGGAGSSGGVGGASAGYAKKNTLALTSGTPVAFLLGAPGTTDSQAGGDTWFSASGTVIANGGGSATTRIGDTTFAGAAGNTNAPGSGCGGSGAAGPGGAGNLGGGSIAASGAGGGGGGNGGGTIGADSTIGAGGAGGNGFRGTGGASHSNGGRGAGAGGADAGGAAGVAGDDYDYGGGGGGGSGTGVSTVGATPGGGGGGGGVARSGGYAIIKLSYAGSDPDQIVSLGTITTLQIPPNFAPLIKGEFWGGGAGGGTGAAASSKGGGGGGTYTRKNALAVTASGTLTVAIGAGGAAQVAGGTTTVSTVTAPGGGTTSTTTAGAAGSAGANGDATNQGAAGGAGLGAAGDVGGGGGGSGGTDGAGVAGSAGTATQTTGAGGRGDSTSGGLGGATAGATNTAGNPGAANAKGGGGGSGSGGSSTAKLGGAGGWPGGGGGGGGGGATSNTGGAGAGGAVILTNIPSVVTPYHPDTQRAPMLAQ